MRTLSKILAFVSVGLLVSASACSGGGNNTKADAGKGDAATDSGKTPPDSGSSADAAVTCTANASYSGALGSQTANYYPTPADAGADAGPMDSYQLEGQYNTDADTLDIELYDGYGVFANGIQPGTYTLSGDELNYGTCGLCVLILANYDGQQGDPYMATGGTVTITSVAPDGTLAGTGSNLTFTHVQVDSQTLQSTPVGDGCNSSIASVSFSATATTTTN